MSQANESGESINRPEPGEYRRFWALEDGLTFFNHGSFGACPTAVLTEQSRLRESMEADPVRFFLKSYPGLLHDAISAFARFVNADPEGVSFLANSSSGINTVLRAFPFEGGDEVLVGTQAYQACRNAIEFVCDANGAKVVVVDTELGFAAEDYTEAYLSAVTRRSRLALIDTVASPTAARLPFESMTRELHRRDVQVLIDASHGPGLVPLDLRALDAEYVVGNCHKWLFTPKGSGFLYAREDVRPKLRPLVISHGYTAPESSRFRSEFDWQGTVDPTPWLCVPKALDHVRAIDPDGFAGLARYCESLAREARSRLVERFGQDAATPAAQTTHMVTARIPPTKARRDNVWEPDPLMVELYDRFRIQTIVFAWPAHDARYLRISLAPYNSLSEVEYLDSALEAASTI